MKTDLDKFKILLEHIDNELSLAYEKDPMYPETHLKQAKQSQHLLIKMYRDLLNAYSHMYKESVVVTKPLRGKFSGVINPIP